MSSTQVGQEGRIVRACFGTVDKSPGTSKPRILAAFEVSNIIPGSVYIEATDPGAVLNAIRGLNGVPRTPCIDFVPFEDRPALLHCHTISKLYQWVRVGVGEYRGDLGFVREINPSKCEAKVLLVPRWQRWPPDEDWWERKRTRRPRGKPHLFDPHLPDIRARLMELAAGSGVGIYVFNDNNYRDGL